MMGSSSGSYKVGGGSLSSSSNLSPLAPPFMVNKSSSTNPSMNFPELPVYGTVFDPAGPFSAVGHKFGATEPQVTTTCPPSGGVYGYLGSQSSNSDIYYVGHNTGYDPFSYDQFPNNISNRNGDDGDVKPYYAPYVSSPPQVNGSSYDLLSSSSSGHFNGYSSPQVDHTQGASCGEEYKPKWGGFWSGVGNGEHEKWTECAPSSGLKDFNVSNVSGNKSLFSADGSNQSHPFGDASNNSRPFGDASSKSHVLGEVGNRSNLKQGASAAQGLDSHGVGSTISGNTFDIFGGTYHLGSLGIHNQGQNLSFKNLATSSSDCSRMSCFVPGTPSIESPGLQRPVLESLTTFSGSQKVNGSSSEDHHFGQTGYYMFGGSTSSAGSTLSAIQVNPVTKETASSINPSAGQDSSYQKQPHMPLGVDFQPGVAIRRPLFSSKFGSSIQKEEAVNGALDVKFTSDKPKFPPQLPRQFSSDGFAPKANEFEVEYSAEKHSSGSDLHNPAEDSPCWKGASSTRFSPFSSVSEAVAANVFVNQEDGCKSPGPEEPQKKNPPVDASNSSGFSSEKVNESNCPPKPTVPSCTSEDDQEFGSGNPKSYCIDLNIPEGLEFLDDCHVFTKDSSILNDQRSVLDSKLSSATKKIVTEDEVSSALNIPEASVAAKNGNCTPTGAQSSSGVLSKNGTDHSCSTLGEKCSLKHNQSAKKKPDSKFDVNGVLKSMMKQSQMLHAYCLGNPTALTYQQLMTLQQIVSNLSASQTSPTMIFSTQDSHFWDGFPVPEMLNYDELLAPADKQADPDEYFRELSEGFDTFQDYNMTQGIKKILHDNLHEEIDQPEVSYRNLWLEAEAALCVMTTKARFNRMKIEMEKNSQHGMEDKENPSSTKISSDEHGPVALAPEGKDSPALVRESRKSSTTRECNATGEIPVSNSQHPCLNSVKVSIPKEPRKELIFPQFSYDTTPFFFGNDSHGSVAPNHANDVDDSVMTRYQILKSRGDDDSLATLNNDESKQCSNEDLLSQDTSCIDTHISGTSNHARDVETPIMARYQILNSCVGDPETLKKNDEVQKQSSGEDNYDLSRIPAKNDVETSVMARYQILKCRMENSGSLNDGKESPEGEDYLINGDPLSPNKQVLNPKLFDSIGSTSSVMARFRVIQNRVSSSNSVTKDPPQENRAAEEEGDDEIEGHGWAKENSSSFMTNIFGPYPNFSEDNKDVKKLDVSISVGEEPLATTSYKANKLRTEIFEGWYENDCTSSDWEHVSKEELRSKN